MTTFRVHLAGACADIPANIPAETPAEAREIFAAEHPRVIIKKVKMLK